MAAFRPLPLSGFKYEQYDMKASEVYTDGAFLLFDTGEVAECVADPTTVMGLAVGASGDHVDPTKQIVAVFREDARILISGDDAPVEANIGVKYGAVVDGDGIWTLDGTETTTVSLYVENIDLIRNLYICRILEAVLPSVVPTP